MSGDLQNWIAYSTMSHVGLPLCTWSRTSAHERIESSLIVIPSILEAGT